jgi:lipoprotein-anchoring transpeptidase ErfK/SrfK
VARRIVVLLSLAVVVFGTSACKDEPKFAARRSRTTTPTQSQYISTVATAVVPEVAVFDTPDAPEPKQRIKPPDDPPRDLVFLVKTERSPWLEVHLPVRPNGSTGWIREADVKLTQHDYRITVELANHKITVTKGTAIVRQEPIAVGKDQTPTPGGLYYTKELLKAPNPNTVYGPYAYGLNGFSNVLTTFAGTDAVIGIHGTNDNSVLGKDVSAGCIRMSNEGITKLAETLPLGVPVEIKA